MLVTLDVSQPDTSGSASRDDAKAYLMSVTLEVSQLATSGSAFDASLNMYDRLLTLEMSQFDTSGSAFVAPENRCFMSFTREVSQRETSGLALVAYAKSLSMLVTRAVTWDLVEGERTSSYVYNQPYVGGDAARFSAELSMALTIAFAHHFVGHGHTPIEARFRHAAPRHLAAYERVFQCPLVFRAERNELVFDSKLLDEVPMQHDELVWNALNQRAEHLLAEDNGAWGLPERVKSALHHESDLGDVDTGGVARRLGLTSRGLRRRLSEEGRPLSTLIAEVRCELACARLRDPDSCIKDLADNLGFSEPSAFHRAFKRWTGQTPAQYRSGGSGGSASRASGAAPQLSLVG